MTVTTSRGNVREQVQCIQICQFKQMPKSICWKEKQQVFDVLQGNLIVIISAVQLDRGFLWPLWFSTLLHTVLPGRELDQLYLSRIFLLLPTKSCAGKLWLLVFCLELPHPQYHKKPRIKLSEPYNLSVNAGLQHTCDSVREKVTTRYASSCTMDNWWPQHSPETEQRNTWNSPWLICYRYFFISHTVTIINTIQISLKM